MSTDDPGTVRIVDPEPSRNGLGHTAVPRVAILVACFNDGATIDETVATLRGEPDTELVIVDDGSTDAETLDALEKLERDGVRILRQRNSGPSSAWMMGLAATDAPYVMSFSSDDLLVPGATTALADALDASPETAAAWGDMHSFGAAHAYLPAAPALCPWHITYVNSLRGIALFRRSKLREVGGGDSRAGSRTGTCRMRLAARGLPGIHVPTVVFHYRRDAGGRFRSRVNAFDGFYEELRERNQYLFDARAETIRVSPAPFALRLLLPVVDRLPIVSRLLKMQLCDLLTLVFWSAGPTQSLRIVRQGVLFRFDS